MWCAMFPPVLSPARKHLAKSMLGETVVQIVIRLQIWTERGESAAMSEVNPPPWKCTIKGNDCCSASLSTSGTKRRNQTGVLSEKLPLGHRRRTRGYWTTLIKDQCYRRKWSNDNALELLKNCHVQLTEITLKQASDLSCRRRRLAMKTTQGVEEKNLETALS
nr:hypothetical protein Iba_chr10eCG4930 [Ipomoea batatas]